MAILRTRTDCNHPSRAPTRRQSCSGHFSRAGSGIAREGQSTDRTAGGGAGASSRDPQVRQCNTGRDPAHRACRHLRAAQSVADTGSVYGRWTEDRIPGCSCTVRSRPSGATAGDRRAVHREDPLTKLRFEQAGDGPTFAGSRLSACSGANEPRTGNRSVRSRQNRCLASAASQRTVASAGDLGHLVPREWRTTVACRMDR